MPGRCNLPAVPGLSLSESHVTDELLMRAVRAGDCVQLGALFERYHTALFDFLCRTTGDRTAAEDLVQDVFVRILKNRHTYRDDSCFETWLYRIARNARSDFFRRRTAVRMVDIDYAEPSADDPDPTEGLQMSADTARLKRALMRIPADKRELLVLARYRNMRYEQIAAVLEIEVGAVKVRVHRALKHLREMFEQIANEEAPCGVKTPRSLSDRR
jgi:RNA polymerase sigma factor (sigma-70 family)